jgi:hypothetical protein
MINRKTCGLMDERWESRRMNKDRDKTNTLVKGNTDIPTPALVHKQKNAVLSQA